MNAKTIIITAAISGALAVAIGAFGAHGLQDHLAKFNRINTFETGVKYHFYHTLALLAVGLLALKLDSAWLNYSAYSLIIGIIVFSGALYTLSITNTKWLGAIAPIGGLAFILGWVFLAIAAFRNLP